MSTAWTTAPLGELLTKSDNWVVLDAEREYKEVTVRLWGRGVALRGIVSGPTVAGTRRMQVNAGEFIVSRIDARNGAFGLISEELDSAVVTNDFPVFSVNEERVLSSYLNWLSKTNDFVEACKAASEGTTNRVRLKEDRFLQIEIPLPPLAEQRRIVAKIERLAGKIEEARGLRELALSASDAILHSAARLAFSELRNCPSVMLESVCSSVIDCLHSNPVYSETGIPTIRSSDVGWGMLLIDQARRTSGSEYERRTLRGKPMPGDIIIVREGGGTGKAGIVEEGHMVSLGQRVMQVTPDTTKVLPRFFLHQWLSPIVQEDQIQGSTKGSASPHLNISAMKKFRFLLPSLAEQAKIVAYLDRMHQRMSQAKLIQSQAAAELDALLPAILDRAFKGAL